MDLTSYLLGKKAGGGGGASGPDWSTVGFESTPQTITVAYNKAKDIYDNWEVKTDYSSAYENDSDIIIFPVVDLSSATNITKMFQLAKCLVEVGDMNCSNVTYLSRVFNNCNVLRKIGEIDCSSVTNADNYAFNYNDNLVYFGGLKDLGKAFPTSWSQDWFTLDLSKAPKLNHDSLINIINKLYDIKAKGCNNQTLKLGSTNLAKLTAEEIAIATAKGWNLTS